MVVDIKMLVSGEALDPITKYLARVLASYQSSCV